MRRADKHSDEGARLLVRHWLKFNAVGAAGILVQASALAFLIHVARVHYLVATVLAVEAAVLHNFFWHRRWTWGDRPGVTAARLLRMLARFNLTTGLFSIAGNLFFMRILAGAAGLDPLVANLVTIALCSLMNFVLSDRLVFVPLRISNGTQMNAEKRRSNRFNPNLR